MLHFNRKTEYALIALEHMLRKNAHEAHALTSAREVSEAYQIPFPLLAKVLQKLAARGLIKSVHGTKGGYILGKPADDITVADVAEIYEGPLAVVECFKDEKITCPQWDGCRIKNPLYELNHKIYHMLTKTTMADLANGQVSL
ncbi:MAG: Rrf2 family transcriptional regulator [bacterium]|nr:Rrf2 family transcriptional regulator [bacterium]